MENKALLDDDRTIIHLPINVYASVSEFIVEKLKQGRVVSLHHLLDEALKTTSIQFVGDPAWCFLQVKRDLEARGVIRVKIQRRPTPIQNIRLGRKRRQSWEAFS
jgi:hypothetical protein